MTYRLQGSSADRVPCHHVQLMLLHAQESIKQSQQWFMACLPYAPGMAAALALHVRNLPDYDKQLHVLYLTNDILLKR